MKFIELFCGIGGFRYGLERINRHMGAEPTNEKSEQTKPEVQFGGLRSAMEEERGILSFNDRRIGAIHSDTRKGNDGLESINRSPDRRSQKDTQENAGAGQGFQSEKGQGISTKGGQYNEQPNSNPDSRAFNCIWANDIDKYACQIYRKNYGTGELYEGDITTVESGDIPDHDLLVGGFPCQSFSIAGKRQGFKDTRGTLFFDIARILEQKRPRYLLLENVRGLLSHNNGQTFQTILEVLADIGYLLQWEVLNSKNFGVPQNRERVFIIGHLRGTRRPEVFPIRAADQEINKGIVSTAIDGNYWKGPDKHGQRTMIEITKNKPDAQRIYDSNGIAKTLKGLGGGQGAKTGLYAIRKSGDLGKQKTTLKDEMRALAANPSSDHIARVTDGSSIRRLTPTECERLQGFPDGWTEKGIDTDGNEVNISDTQRYRCLGNAVTTNVIYEIGKRIFNSLHY